MTTITGLVLAGGMARRMGGQDKGLIQFNGIAMAQRIADQLSTQCDKVLINANRNQEIYSGFGYDVICDVIEGYQGPLAGLLSGLRAIETQWLISVPCDGPFLNSNYVDTMLAATQSNQTALAVASDEKRLQPVYAILDRSLENSLAAFLKTGERKIDKWYCQHSYTSVVFAAGCRMFENINTPEQLATLEQS